MKMPPSLSPIRPVPMPRPGVPERPAFRGRVWPVPRASLAALSDLGMSDGHIAAYFGVTRGDVAAVRRPAGAGEPDGAA